MTTKKIHCFRHVSFEGLGCMKKWFNEKSYPITYTDFFESDFRIPSPQDYDVLIIMGGPMGTYEEEQYAWLKAEKEAIRKAIDNHKAVIGICLGSQLIANTLGAKVYKNAEKEIGWWKIKFSNEGKKVAPFDTFNEEITVFQWHGDTFDIPKGATRIASSDICKNQAFIYNHKVLGLQFHFEVDKENIQLISDSDLGELEKGGNYVQTLQQIRAGERVIPENIQLMYRILEELIG